MTSHLIEITEQELSVDNIPRRCDPGKRPKFKISVTGSKVLIGTNKKGVFIMHLYLKYQSPNTFGSKDIAKVKVFQN
jgi:hypothetical protein